MENTIEHIDELIGKYLAHEASDTERAQVERWATESAANKKYLEHCKIIFAKASEVKTSHHFDEDAAWEKVKAKLSKEAKVVSLDHKHSRSSFYYYWVAASVIVILGIGLFMLRELNKPREIELVAETTSLNNVLPDGSNVFLNKKTKLSYVYDKKKKSHVVKLKGEAFFKIKHEEKKNLVVEAEGVFIHDIGTAFNVKAYPETNTIEVVVEEGEVEFYTSENVGLRLGASAKGIYNKTTKQFSLARPESNVLAYKTRVFSFDATTLGDVVRDLNKVYDKKIVLPDHLKNCRLTVYFNNEDIDEIADVIAETLGLSVKRTESEILLEGAACE